MKDHNSIPGCNFMGNYKAALSKVQLVASFHFSFINLGKWGHNIIIFYYYYCFILPLGQIGRFVVKEIFSSIPACRAQWEVFACLFCMEPFIVESGIFNLTTAIIMGNTGSSLGRRDQKIMLHHCLCDFCANSWRCMIPSKLWKSDVVYQLLQQPVSYLPYSFFSAYRYPLRRGSSFTFLTPGPHWDFTLVSKTAGGFILQKHTNKSRNTEVKVLLSGRERKSTRSSLPGKTFSEPLRLLSFSWRVLSAHRDWEKAGYPGHCGFFKNFLFFVVFQQSC